MEINVDKVSLYTRQKKSSLLSIKRNGRLILNDSHLRERYMEDTAFYRKRLVRYSLMAKEIVAPAKGATYPIFCHISKKITPWPRDGEIVYCLEVPKDQIVFIDSLKWTYILNNMYIPKNPEDKEKYVERIKKLGVKDEYNFLQGGKYEAMFPDVENTILDSWNRVFQVDKWTDFTVQGVLWEIREEWIRHLVHPGDNIFDLAEEMPDLLDIN